MRHSGRSAVPVFPGCKLAFFLDHFGYGSVYSYCIGALCFSVMYYLGPRYYRLRPAYRIPAFLQTFTAAATVGSAVGTLIFTSIGWIAPSEFWSEFYFCLHIAIAFTLLIGMAVTAFEVLARRLEAATLELRTRQLQEERARKLASEALLNLAWAREVDAWFGGRVLVRLKDAKGTELQVARERAQDLKRRLTI